MALMFVVVAALAAVARFGVPAVEGTLSGSASTSAAADHTDEELRAVWQRLSPDERRDVVEYADLDLSHAETFQLALVRHVLGTLECDPLMLDPAPAPVWFDPELHAPAQPIPRRLLPTDSPKLLAARRSMENVLPERRASTAFAYDWPTRAVVRTGERDDPTRRFEELLAGRTPDHDLVFAIVLRAIDDGEQTQVLDAFARLYSDRDGNVYPGITLYDAWSSGASIEMPDVDTLGLVHVIDDEWKRWKAPVPAKQQEPLYSHLGTYFVDARHHRGLREALASAYLVGEPAYRDGYTSGNTVGFHALWNRASSDPAALLPLLPKAKEWAAFLERINAEFERDREAWRGGEQRRETLLADARFVRGRLVAILADLGHFAAPAAPPAEDTRRGAGSGS
jgi:hypothetical protein